MGKQQIEIDFPRKPSIMDEIFIFFLFYGHNGLKVYCMCGTGDLHRVEILGLSSAEGSY